MSERWGKIWEKVTNLILWCFENHPGKSIGLLIGFFLALAFIILGFWQTIFLLVLTYVGYYLGKSWDEGELPSLLTKLLHRISFKSKN